MEFSNGNKIVLNIGICFCNLRSIGCLAKVYLTRILTELCFNDNDNDNDNDIANDYCY